MCNNVFRGLGVALVTPFSADGGVDFASLSGLVDYVVAGGADFVCALGSTAETPCLSVRERMAVKDAVVGAVGGRVPVLLGMGGNDTAALCEEIGCFDFSGVSGILSVVPFYNRPSQRGIYEHFGRVAEAAGDMPVVLYNVPGRTGVNMQAATTLRLAHDYDNIVAVKEASGSVAQIGQIVEGAPEGFGVLSGDDSLTCDLLLRGACGVVSVVGNAAVRTFGGMVRAALAGDAARAAVTNGELQELYGLVFAEGNPAGIKALLAAKGLCLNVLRLPLTPVSQQTADGLQRWASVD